MLALNEKDAKAVGAYQDRRIRDRQEVCRLFDHRGVLWGKTLYTTQEGGQATHRSGLAGDRVQKVQVAGRGDQETEADMEHGGTDLRELKCEGTAVLSRDGTHAARTNEADLQAREEDESVAVV